MSKRFPTKLTLTHDEIIAAATEALRKKYPTIEGDEFEVAVTTTYEGTLQATSEALT